LSARKVNTSTRPHGPAYYYDEACIKLVARRERFIIDKFGYRDAKPALATVAPARPPAAAVAEAVAEADAGRPWAQNARKEQHLQLVHHA